VKLKQRPDGRYTFRFYPDGVAGPQRRVILPKGLTFAQALRQAKKIEGAEAAKKVRGRPTLRQLAERYLASAAKDLSAGWAKTVETYLNDRILPALGARHAEDLTPHDLQRYRRRRMEDDQPASAVVAAREVVVLTGVLSWAVSARLLDRHPIPPRSLKMGGRPKPRLVFFEREEWGKFLAAFDDPERWRKHLEGMPRDKKAYRPDGERAGEYLSRLRASMDVFRALLLTGSRLGEIVEVTWRDVDLRGGRIRIHQGKTERPKTLPIGPSLRALLEAQPKRSSAALVFQRPGGGRWDESKLKAAFRLARKLAGLRSELTIHAIRHTAASWVVMATGDLKAAQELLGHADISTTMIYSHLSPAHLAGKLAALEPVQPEAEAAPEKADPKPRTAGREKG